MKWSLTPISKGLPEQNIKIQQDILVGRHIECDLVLQDAKVSRKHAIFSVKKTDLWVEDLQSSNGTYVNGEKIETTTHLNGDEQIQFADLIFQLEKLEDLVVEEQKLEQPADSTQNVESSPAEPSSQPQTVHTKDSSPQPAKKNQLLVIVSAVIAFIFALSVWIISK